MKIGSITPKLLGGIFGPWGWHE